MPPRDSDDPTPDGTEVATDATRPEQLLTAVQDAALERALLDDDDAARHLGLAGGLEHARRVTAEGDAPGRSDPFGSALLAITTFAAFDAREGGADVRGFAGPKRPSASPGTASPWRPTSADDIHADAVDGMPTDSRNDPHPSDAVIEGAALAVRRFDADIRRAAALADVPVATLVRRIESSPEPR